MPYARKYHRKPRPYSKRKSMHKRRPRRAYSGKAGIKGMGNKYDSTISVLNQGRDKPIRVVKSLPLNQPYSLGGVTKGANFVLTTSAVNWGQVLTFDPAGVQGFNAGSVGTSTSLLSPAAIAEWVAYKVLYTEYKVNRITLKFNCGVTLGNQMDDNPVTIYIRNQKEWIANPGTASGVGLGTLAEMRNVVRKTFTSEHPDFEYSFVPKVARLLDAGGTGSTTDTRALKPMGYCSVNTPADLWGIQLYTNWAGSSVGNTALLQMDITYDISFRNQS